MLALLLLTACHTTAPLPAPTAQNAHAWLEISEPAFEHNLAEMKKLVGANTQICAVMKADAYGHGISLLMPAIIRAAIPYVGITSNEEAAEARRAGYKGKLMRLRTATPAEIEAALPYDIEELLGNLALAQDASAIAHRHHITLRYHLALNSGGMSRNGIELKTDAGKSDALALLRLPQLRIVGIMTHFPVEEVADVRGGLAAFNNESAWIIREGHLDRSKLLLHTANSFTTLEVPEARLDLVRPGGALYGDTVPSHTEYQRVLSFKSRVAAVNAYPKGNTVCYDRTFTLTRDSRLANIPVGYSDGYRRVFSNKAHVLIDGHRCPIVGRVTMNTVMVDVTDFADVQAGDEVVLFGKQGAAEISQTELEDMSGTILVEVYGLWGRVNPRLLVM
ncbi:MAG: alanine racemase [Verrucomicrobiales bacterium]|nr:alanine racemase [Verrucomicrobiales bacterium]